MSAWEILEGLRPDWRKYILRERGKQGFPCVSVSVRLDLRTGKEDDSVAFLAEGFNCGKEILRPVCHGWNDDHCLLNVEVVEGIGCTIKGEGAWQELRICCPFAGCWSQGLQEEKRGLQKVLPLHVWLNQVNGNFGCDEEGIKQGIVFLQTITGLRKGNLPAYPTRLFSFVRYLGNFAGGGNVCFRQVFAALGLVVEKECRFAPTMDYSTATQWALTSGLQGQPMIG